MADFSFLSDSDDEKAVEELLSQATDHSVLEQIAAINCSGFSDSVLPTQLESRFRKLKSFPVHASKHKSSSKGKVVSNSPSDDDGEDLDLEKESAEKKGFKGNSESGPGSKCSKLSSFEDKDEIFSESERSPGGEKGLKGNRKSVGSKCSKSLSFSGKDEVFSNFKKGPDAEKCLKENLEAGFGSSPSRSSKFSPENNDFSGSKKTREAKQGGKLKFPDGKMRGMDLQSPSDSSIESLSPPQRSGCLWCSPKRVSTKNSKGNRSSLNMSLDWGKDNQFLSDLKTFSGKNQQKLLKKAMKEEEKISREAEKIVKLARHASARMEVSSIEDELSDTDSFK